MSTWKLYQFICFTIINKLIIFTVYHKWQVIKAVNYLRGLAPFKYVFIIAFRGKCVKKNNERVNKMKVCFQNFSAKLDKKYFHRKYMILGGSAKILSPISVLQIKIYAFISFSTTKSVKWFCGIFIFFCKIKFGEFIHHFLLRFHSYSHFPTFISFVSRKDIEYVYNKNIIL